MKSLVVLFITLASLVSHAEVRLCTDAQIKHEARVYLYQVSQNQNFNQLSDCLKAAIDHEIKLEGGNLTVQDRVLRVLEIIHQDEMTAEIKCETTQTPGCLGTDSDMIFTPAEERMLQKDADLKREAIEKAHERGDGVLD